MKRLILALALCFTIVGANAQQSKTDSIIEYRRSSLYSTLITHSALPYSAEIHTAFMDMPMPDKFNDHNLATRAFESSASKVKKAKNNAKKDATNMADIDNFISQNEIAKALISKWFNRDAATGNCDMNLIAERGYYDASQLDIRLAEQSVRGKAQLGDAGTELIGNTFMLVNDITFIDKGENSEKAAVGIKVLGTLFGAITGVDVDAVTDLAATAVNSIDGFRVNITSYLYRLTWDEERLWGFYNQYYADENYSAEERNAARDAFNALPYDDPFFGIEFIGKTTTSAANLSSKYFAEQSKEDQMLKVCTRAIDKSIVQLQRAYEIFRVNVPIYRINDDGTVDVQIGLKEGINEKSEFDVLMPVEDENGRITYEKVGRISPIKGKIWDNRFGALEDAKALEEDKDAKADEDAAGGNAYLEATTFKVNSGANRIMPGCLVREATIK